jgi:transposase
VRDLPIGGRLTRLVWREQRYRCSECGRTFTETHEQLPTRGRVTARFRARLAERRALLCANGSGRPNRAQPGRRELNC